ncbi:MAG: hypothetical protein LBB61_05445, partial [Treponema sp.]|nr:hypothetical protein [Treponema sp.]
AMTHSRVYFPLLSGSRYFFALCEPAIGKRGSHEAAGLGGGGSPARGAEDRGARRAGRRMPPQVWKQRPPL